jgi:transposase-like protein
MTKKNVAEEMARLREQRWTTKDARRALAACDDSGLSVAAFAREHGVKQQRLSWWRKRLGEWDRLGPAAGGTSPVQFVPAVVQVSRVAAGGTIAIRVLDGVTVEIADVSPQWVAALVRGLCEAAS